MAKFVVFYRTPDDAAGFDAAYFGTHLPLVEKTPGLVRAEVVKVARTVHGGPPVYLMATLHFPDDCTMKAALRSPEWAASGENLQSFGGLDLATMFTVLDTGAQ